MGSLHSKTSYVYIDYGYYKSYINTLDTESVSRVYNKILADKFRTRKQMQACGILIYEKAVDEPEFSLKCAQLAKELEDELIIEDGKKQIFHVVFSDYLIPFLTFIIAKYDDKYMNKRLVQRGMGISTFIGNLYNVGFYGLPQIVEMAQQAKKKVTPKSAFFMENILNTCSEKLESKHVSLGFFEMMVAKYRREDFFDSTQTTAKDVPRTEFIQFLHKMKTENRHEFYQKYSDFKSLNDQVHKMEIKFLMKYILENEQLLNVYRFVALEIHRASPAMLKIDLKFEFDKAIEKYEVIKDVNSEENIKNLEHLGKVIIEFYTAGLIDDEVVEHFLNVMKSTKVPIKVFNLIFVELMKKYEGKHLMDYYRYLNRKCKKLPEMQMVAAIIEDYVVSRTGMDSELQFLESEAAAQPDLREFTTSIYKLHEPFKCEDRQSCHVASLRGIDILMRHIGHKFFTSERIEICAKMTRKFSKIPIEDRICERLEKEMKVYLPYFKQIHAPSMQMRGFSNLLVEFYNEGVLRHATIDDWMKQLLDVVRNKKNRYCGRFTEIYMLLFKKIDNNFLSDDPNLWLMHFKFIENLEFAKIKFDDFGKFKELVESFKEKSEFTDEENLKSLDIPNNKIAIRQVSRFLVDFYVNNKTNPSLIASILSKLLDNYKPQLCKCTFQSEFQHAMCLKLSFIFASNRKSGSQLHSHAVLITDLLEVICTKNQSIQLELSDFCDVILRMAVKYDNLYSVFNFVKISYEKLSTALSLQEDTEKLAIEDSKSKLDLKIKEVRDIFGDFLKDANKIEAVEGVKSKSSNIASNPSTDQQISINNIKDYSQYCIYYNSLTSKTSQDDENLFNLKLISKLKIHENHQVTDFTEKFIERILAGQSKASFFAQNTVKIENLLRQQKFKKILTEKIIEKFENQELLVQFMCELYNSSFVNKASMNAFVDKFKSLSPENLVLMHTFVRTCAIRLSSQGDKEQLNQIRTIARSVKNLSNYDEELKLIAENLESTLDSLILKIEGKEDIENVVKNLIEKALIDPQVPLKSFIKFDGKFKKLLNLKCEELLKITPSSHENYKNLIEFTARFYNFGILSADFIIHSLDLLLDSSNEEASCQSIEILFRKCGWKLEQSKGPKLNVYFKFFKAVLAENESSIRATYFDRILKLKSQNWKTIQNSESFYENFLLTFKIDEAKFEEIIENFMTDDEEIDKFILILWKIVLKEKLDPTIANVCGKISKYCHEFQVRLSRFLAARCQTFHKLIENSNLFDENVKQRLGKVMTFVAEIFNRNVVADEILELWINSKFIDSVSHEIVAALFNEMSGSRRLEGCKNDNVKELVARIEDKYYEAINERIDLIIDDLEVENL